MEEVITFDQIIKFIVFFVFFFSLALYYEMTKTDRKKIRTKPQHDLVEGGKISPLFSSINKYTIQKIWSFLFDKLLLL